MNRKQLILILVVGAVVVGLGALLYRRDTSAWKSSGQSMGQKALGEFPINEVSSIVIQQQTNTLHLVRKGEAWHVKERFEYPANFSEIGDTLRKLWELKTVQAVKVGASQLGRLDLLPPDQGTNSGTLVQLKDASGKTIKSVLLGKKHVKKSGGEASPFGGGGEWPDGRYLLVGEPGQDVAVISDPLNNLEPKAETWIDKEFFKVEKLKSVAVTHTQDTNSWKIHRETEGGELKLADAKPEEKFDATKASTAGNLFSYPSFTDVVSPEAKPETTGLHQPMTATVETFEGFTYQIKIGSKTPEENYHLQVATSASLAGERTPGKDEKPEDKEKLDKEFKEKQDKLKEKLAKEKALANWTYLVSKWNIDAILKNRADFMADKKGDEKKDGGAADSEIDAPIPNINPPPIPLK